MLDTKVLREKVLQLAIQGKLVEQRTEEGTAEDLYKQIQEEKKKLIAEKKIKKEKPLLPIKLDEIPFDIPNSWKWVRLGNIVSVLGGKRIPAGRTLTEDNTGHKYIRVSDMHNGTVEIANIKYVPSDIYPSIKNYIITKDDIYITVAGTIGRIGKIPKELDGANLTENSDGLVFSKLNQDWLIFVLSSSFVQNKILDVTTQVGQPKLAIKRIQELVIPLPPLGEQNRIVQKIEQVFTVLDSIDENIESYRQEQSKLNEKIMDAAIRGKLVEQHAEEGTAEELYKQILDEKKKLIAEKKIKKEKALAPIKDDEIPFDIPESWKWVRLIEVCKSVADGDHQAPPQTNEGIPFVVISNVSSGYLNFKDVRHVDKKYFESLAYDRKAQQGDILFTVTGSYGIVLEVDSDQVFCFQRHIALLKPLINRSYLKYVLKSGFIKKQCDDAATGVAQKTVGICSLKNLLVPLPPLAEQKRIVEKIEQILPLCERLK